LIAAGAIGAVVSWLTNAWVILMISLVLLVVVVGTVRRRGRTPH
jgi:hypothetical protein